MTTRMTEAQRTQLAVEWERAADSFPYFLAHHTMIVDRSQAVDTLIPWQWWPVHDEMCAEAEHPFVIWLKGRQISVTWFWASRAAHKILFRQNALVLVFSKGERETKEFLEKVRTILTRVPYATRLNPDNTEQIRVVATGGTIQALPSTQEAGRSYTADLVIVDEAAYHPYAASDFAAYSETLAPGGQIAIVSTASGVGNWFHGMYQAAKDGQSRFKHRFWPWYSRPGRDEAWREERRREFRAAGDEKKLAQEHPTDDVTAFLLSGRPRFDPEMVQWLLAQARDSMPISRYPALSNIDGLSVWALPQPGMSYVMGTDSAQGLGDGDYDCTDVVEVNTLRHMATLHGRWEPDRFAELSVLLGMAYSQAFWGVENAPQGHGHTVLATARRLGYPRLYWRSVDQTRRQQNEMERPTERLGWVTSAATKPLIIDNMAAVIASGRLVTSDKALLQECLTYEVDASGGTHAVGRHHDDRVMAMAIALWMCQQPEARLSVLPRGIRPKRLSYAWSDGRHNG